MTMTETPAVTQKPKRKYTRRKRAAVAPKQADDLAGISIADCPNACSTQGCVISGKFYCGHPYKGGLQGRDMNDQVAMARVTAAKKLLGKKKIKVAADA